MSITIMNNSKSPKKSFLFSRNRPPVLEGVLAWLVLLQFLMPSSLRNNNYIVVILLFAPLVIVPLGIQYTGTWKLFLKPISAFMFPSALFSALPFCIPQIALLSYAAIPWLIWTLAAASLAFRYYMQDSDSMPLSLLVGFLYLPIGAAWLLANRLGLHPLGFQDSIILLTAVHFHYAGFILPLVTASNFSKATKPLQIAIIWGIMLGVLLVAFGIIFTHYTGIWWGESIFGSLMAISGIGLAIYVITLPMRQKIMWQQAVLLILGAILLLLGMSFAILYAWRNLFPFPMALDIPSMYAFHGTINILTCLLLILRVKSSKEEHRLPV